jgi:protocatechuate 3,4-dioxygenase beta subunit
MSAPRRARRAALALFLAAGLGAGAIAGAPAFASGEAGGPPDGSGTTPTGTSNCPSSNPPDQMTLVAGTPQTTTLDTAFASGLQVALTSSDGCAVTDAAGIPVTFSAPTAGAGGTFSASDSNSLTVGADASGDVAAPAFAANSTAGSYTVIASSRYGSVSFSLTNTAAGIAAQLVAIPLKRRSASVTSRYPLPLQVRVLDASGNPVAGTSVAFTLGSASAGACGASTAATASFVGGGAQATATTNAGGLAASPAFVANAAAGSFTATAAVASGAAAGSEGSEKTASSGTTPVNFFLANTAGTPTKIAPGVGSTQSTRIGSPFAIRLAVTVTDAESNPVAGALVAFSAPATGASGRFVVRSRGARRDRGHDASRPNTVRAETDACGIAVAPPFTANRQQGGYVVRASLEPARPAAFALVNEASG